MQTAVRREYGAAVRERQGLTGERGGPAAGLGDYQRAGGVVPGLEHKLGVGVQPPGGDVAEVEGGAAGASYVLARVVQQPHLPDRKRF